MKPILPFLAVVLFVFAADYLWLGVIMKGFYQQEIGGLMRRNEAGAFSPRVLPALLVYLLIPIGVVAFAVPQAENGSIVSALAWGSLLGLIVYGIYEFSNFAVLERWTWRIVIADILWGMFLCGTASVIGFATRRWLSA